MTRSGPIATAVRGYDPDVFIYQTDLAKAKELILAGGFAEGDTFEYIFSPAKRPPSGRSPSCSRRISPRWASPRHQ